MSQDLKHLDEENIEEMILTDIFHVAMKTLLNGPFSQKSYEYRESSKKGKQAVYCW
jgi:hypothetical protein